MQRVLWLTLIALVLSACGSITGNAKIDEMETKNAQLQATIDMIGTPILTIVALEQYATQNVVLQARLSQAENESLAARATLTVLELSGGVAVVQPTLPPPDIAVSPNNQPPPDQITPTPVETAPALITASGNGLTQFSQTITTTALDQRDCALDNTTVFDPTEEIIYVNTQINYLPAGSRLGAQWTANGQLYFDDVECWIPEQDYFDICAYCLITPENGGFESGAWTVALLLDGQLMSQTSFQVSGAALPGDVPSGGE